MSRKINQEQIKIDRRLAWERVKELLGGDEDEEEEEGGEATKSGRTTLLTVEKTLLKPASSPYWRNICRLLITLYTELKARSVNPLIRMVTYNSKYIFL